jgi:poly(3-hydroxybutyrate) depolymerase
MWLLEVSAPQEQRPGQPQLPVITRSRSPDQATGCVIEQLRCARPCYARRMRRAVAAIGLLLCACGGGAARDDVDGAAGGDDAPGAPDAAENEAGPGPTQECPFTADGDGFFTLTSARSDYVVRLPGGYDVAAPQPQRLLVAIHGCGDSAYNFATWGAVPYALRDSQDYLAISIGGRDGECWNITDDGAIVTAAIEHVRSCFYVHQKQIVLAGYSSGGMLSYKLAMTDAPSYAGALIENSGLSQGVGGNVDAALDAAGWKIHVAHSARIMDGSFDIDGVRADRDKMLAHDFPLEYRELDGTHDGTSDDWSEYLIPAMATWSAP